MKPRNIIALTTIAILLVPNASAVQIYLVDVLSEDFTIYNFQEPIFSASYNFQVNDNILSGPIYHATNLVNYEMGEVEATHVIHVTTTWLIESTSIEYRSYAEKTFLGKSQGITYVYINGTKAYADFLCTQTLGFCGAFGSRFEYQQPHMLVYAENQTAFVPCDNNIPTYTFPAVDNCLVAVKNLTGLFFVPQINHAIFLDPINATSNVNSNQDIRLGYDQIMWLSNISHPDDWSFNTTYQDSQPLHASVTYQFADEETFLADVKAFEESGENCGGLSRIIKSLIGSCPTITGIARFGIELFPNILAFFLDFISPQAATFIRLIGEVAGEFVASYIFVLVLVSGSVGHVLILAAATISGFAFIVGGLRGDMGVIFSAHITGIKYLAIGVFWYFYIYYLLGRWIIELVIKAIDTIGNFIPFT